MLYIPLLMLYRISWIPCIQEAVRNASITPGAPPPIVSPVQPQLSVQPNPTPLPAMPNPMSTSISRYDSVPPAMISSGPLIRDDQHHSHFPTLPPIYTFNEYVYPQSIPLTFDPLSGQNAYGQYTQNPPVAPVSQKRSRLN